MEQTLHLGDRLEVTYVSKVIGYLFKSTEDELVLCMTKRFDPTKIFPIDSGDIVKVFMMGDPEKSVRKAQEPEERDETDNILQFPAKTEIGPALPEPA